MSSGPGGDTQCQLQSENSFHSNTLNYTTRLSNTAIIKYCCRTIRVIVRNRLHVCNIHIELIQHLTAAAGFSSSQNDVSAIRLSTRLPIWCQIKCGVYVIHGPHFFHCIVLWLGHLYADSRCFMGWTCLCTDTLASLQSHTRWAVTLSAGVAVFSNLCYSLCSVISDRTGQLRNHNPQTSLNLSQLYHWRNCGVTTYGRYRPPWSSHQAITIWTLLHSFIPFISLF